MEIKSKVYKLICDLFHTSESELNDNLGPGDLNTWDSLGQIQLISKLEHEFDIQLNVNDVMSINNIGDIITVLTKHSSMNTEQESKSPARQAAIQISALRVSPTTYWGQGALNALSQLKENKIAIITGSESYTKKLKENIESIISTKQVEYFNKPSGEPTQQGIQYLSKSLLSFSPELIVAIGGGSTLDTSKLAWVLYEYPDSNLETFLKKTFTVPNLRKKAKFMAVPTTFGSGSEVSSAATFSTDVSSSKSIIFSHELLSDYIILDPSLGESAPLSVIFGCAFDALTHAIEGYASIINNPIADQYAISAIKLLINSLNEIQSSQLQSSHLESLCYASYLAGIVQNHCSVGLTHSIAHQLGVFGINHGKANAIFLSAVINYNKSYTSRYSTLCNELGFTDVDSLVKTLQKLFKNADFNFEQKVLENVLKAKDSIAIQAMNDITFKTNPESPSKEVIESLIESTISEQISLVNLNA